MQPRHIQVVVPQDLAILLVSQVQMWSTLFHNTDVVAFRTNTADGWSKLNAVQRKCEVTI
jgi:hypothetical protein